MAQIDLIIPHTKKWEGGLSKATTDTASSFPSPYYHNGSYGWHTNKGVTYKTFKAGAERLGYSDTKENFIFMSDEIWLKIAKDLYWDMLSLDVMKSQAIAQLFFSWVWASGYGWRNRLQRYLLTKGINWSKDNLKGFSEIINALVQKQGEKKTFDELIEQYKQFYISLNQPANLGGWLNRLNDLKKYSESFITKHSGGVIGAILLFTGIYLVLKRLT